MESGPTEPGGAPMVMTGWVTLGNGDRRELANLGSRLGARILDWILVGVVVTVLAVIGIVGALASGDGGTFLGVVFGVALAVLVITLLYEMTMIALRGQTVGKMMVGIKVVAPTTAAYPAGGSRSGAG